MGAGNLEGISRIARAALAAALLVGACAGPRPTVSGVRVAPSAAPGRYRVEALVSNHGGKGEAKLHVRLRDVASGRVINHESAVDLEAGAGLDVVVDVAAPPGQYLADVEVEYPPR